MKKVILSVAALLIAATSIFVACKKDEVKKKQRVENTQSKSSLAKKKGAFYYACVDAGGAYTFGKAGAALGHIGIAGGIVLGGVATSAWQYYWDNCEIAVPTPNPLPGFDIYQNQYEKVGYLHNAFLLQTNSMPFIGDSVRSIENFVDLYYDTLTSFCASQYNISLQSFRSTFTKSSLVDRLQSYQSVTNNYSNLENWIGSTVNNPNQVSGYFNSVRIGIDSLNNENLVNAYLIQKINEVSASSNFNQEDKEILLYSLSIWRFSQALWQGN